ncbi:site-specific DNA-methyltransferase [Caldifermentibacillus hisashii]|uniref:Methyltransferase n=1 Tax=Caldifermentibacillus hisashii TaxID=996558 RepID=A0ABU9K2Q9_9BACI
MDKLQNIWIHGDCLKELEKLESESVDLIITSPPYHNLRVYSNDPADLSNCETYEEYYYLLSLVIEECHRVLKPAGKFVIQFEDYNYTLGRDGKRGKESLVGEINQIFLNKQFTLWTEVIWHKYTPQRAMLSDGALWFRNLKNRDTQVAANWGYVYVYRKEGEAEQIQGADITLEDWATWADGVWHISNSGIGHTTPFAEELVRRIIKLWSMPGDTVLDPFAGAGTVNHVAIKNKRNAIGIELKKEFYDLAIEKRFSTYTDDDFKLTYTKEDVTASFLKEKEMAEQGKENAKREAEEKKQLRKQKKDIREEIKELELQLQALGLKKSEIIKLKKGVTVND